MSTLLSEPQLAATAPAAPPAAVATFRPVVVAPTFDNAEQLPAVLVALAELDLPVVVVDDGSTDVTAAVLAAWAAADPGTRTVLAHRANRGKAAALRTAFAHAVAAGHTHAVTIDTDGQLSPADIVLLLDRACGRPAALVLGARDARATGYPLRSRFGRWASNRLVWFESGQTVSDSQCGLRVYPLAFAAAVACAAERFGFETEVITRAAWAAVPVLQVPVGCRYFGRAERVSHFRPVLDSGRAVAMHARLIAAACSPVPPTRAGTRPRPGRTLPRRFLRWVNPVTAWRQARTDDAGRTRFAAGFAAGLFIGALPLYGGQTVLSLYVARRFRLHPMSVMTGSNLSGPPIGVALVALEVAVGHLLLHGSWPALAHYDFAHGHLGTVLRPILCEWVMGAVFVGAGLAGLGFVAVDLLLRLLPEPSVDA